MVSKWILPLCVVQLFVTFSECEQFRCDYTFDNAVGGWLKMHRVPDTWDRARERCRLEGAKLASPTRTLIDKMKFMMGRNNISSCGIFTGIHASVSPGDYYTIEGQPLSKIPHTWAQGEPDSYQNQENCIGMLSDGTLADVNCSDTYPYICYRKSTGHTLGVCGTVDPEYKLETRTGSCYKFHSEPRSWSDAYMACSAEGGYLAIINSVTEAQVIREIYSRNPSSSLPGVSWKDGAYVGYRHWNDKGTWLTVHGQTLEEAGYTTFHAGEPNNLSNQHCGAVYRDGGLDDCWCEERYAFFCEKSVDSLLCGD